MGTWEGDLWPGLAAEDALFYLLGLLRDHFGCLWVDLGSSWIDSGFKLGALGQHLSIGSHLVCLQAALWVGLAAPCLPLHVTWLLWVLRASRMDAAGDQADIAKT